MKNLYLIRHAKSDWSDESKSDFERGLNKRGKKAIFMMAESLKNKKVMPDLILCSAAKRTQLTAKGLARELEYNGKIKYMDDLYMAEPHHVISIIKAIKEKYHNVFIVGHNPETTQLTNMMADETIDNVPTLGIVAFQIPIEQWGTFEPENARLNFFIYPKMYT